MLDIESQFAVANPILTTVIMLGYLGLLGYTIKRVFDFIIKIFFG